MTDLSLPTARTPHDRCYWVLDDALLAGVYPGSTDAAQHERRISSLWHAGIRTFINLMEEEELSPQGKPFVPYEPRIRELAAHHQRPVAHLRFPIVDNGIPTPERMRSILDAIDLSLNQKIPVYVHCFGGIGRTGTVIGCWLMRHGFASRQTVLELLAKLRQADQQRGSREAPECDIQRQFVWSWSERFKGPQRHLEPARSSRRHSARSDDWFTQLDDWFTQLFGFPETNPQRVHEELQVDGNTLTSKHSGEAWTCGHLEVASLATLRERVQAIPSSRLHRLSLSEVIGDATALHADPNHAGALFQVASQFNLLEMVGPEVTPEEGVTIYAFDRTQGPACAIACAAGTVMRNYFVELGTQRGQTANKQIDCLSDIGAALGNRDGRLWSMRNGYALPSADGLATIDRKLSAMSEEERDGLRSKLQIGLQWDTQVTCEGCSHCVTQAYCSAMPVAYSDLSAAAWERFARLILEASYEATLAAAVINASKTGNRQVFLTTIGGGVFGNERVWILDAIRRAAQRFREFALDVKLVSYRASEEDVRALCAAFL